MVSALLLFNRNLFPKTTSFNRELQVTNRELQVDHEGMIR